MKTAHPGSGDKRFRLAIVGAGLITRNAHLPTALSLGEIEVKAIVDPVLPRAQELIREYGLGAVATNDLRAIVGQVDGAIIATPNHTHREIAVPLLEAGISTLIEKPMANSVDEGRAILAAAQRGKTKIAIGHYQRFLDAPQLLRRLLAQGYFGRVTRFVHQYGSSGGWPAMSAYTLKRESVGGGVLVVTGTHFLDRMLNAWGMPDEVQLLDDSRGGPEAHCEGLVRYTSGPHAPLEGLVRYSKCVPLPSGLAIESERGTVLLRDGVTDPIVLIPQDRPSMRLEIRADMGDRFDPGLDSNQRMLRDFVAACTGDRAPEVDGEQGLASLELLSRFYANRRAMDDNWVGGGEPE